MNIESYNDNFSKFNDLHRINGISYQLPSIHPCESFATKSKLHDEGPQRWLPMSTPCKVQVYHQRWQQTI